MGLYFGFSKQGEEFSVDSDMDMKGHIGDSEPTTKSYVDTNYSGGHGGAQGPKGDEGDSGA